MQQNLARSPLAPPRRQLLLSVMGVLVILVIALLAAPAPAANASVRVCAPNKCVTVPSQCLPTNGCGSSLYRPTNPGEYCAPSVGCVTFGGRNWIYIGGPAATPEQRLAATKCAASLGIAVLSGVSGGGPVGVAILGVGITVWGCT